MIPKKILLNFYGILTRKESCFTSLIRRILISYHLHAWIAIKKPYLTARNRLARKVWAKEHALLPKYFWQNVLFSDETTLELHPNKRVIVRRLPNTGMEKKNLSEARKFGEKIDALGFYCPRWSEMSPTSLWNDKFDQIFADFARKSFAGNAFGQKLLQNNAPSHNLIFSKTWFSENGLEILENWPPISPVINVIENV